MKKIIVSFLTAALMSLLILPINAFANDNSKNEYDVYVYAGSEELYHDNVITDQVMDKKLLNELLNDKVHPFNDYDIIQIQVNGVDVTYGNNEEMSLYYFEDEINQIFVTLERFATVYTFDFTINIDDNVYTKKMHVFGFPNDLTSLSSMNRYLFESDEDLKEYDLKNYYLNSYYLDGTVNGVMIEWNKNLFTTSYEIVEYFDSVSEESSETVKDSVEIIAEDTKELSDSEISEMNKADEIVSVKVKKEVGVREIIILIIVSGIELLAAFVFNGYEKKKK